MSITSKIVYRWIEVTVTIPHDTDYDLFDHTSDWRMVVFSNRRQAMELQVLRSWQGPDSTDVTMKLRSRDFDRLAAIIG